MIYSEIKVGRGVLVVVKYHESDISDYELKLLKDNIAIAMSKSCFFKDGTAYGKSKLEAIENGSLILEETT